jgi:hypothetical protein
MRKRGDDADVERSRDLILAGKYEEVLRLGGRVAGGDQENTSICQRAAEELH